MSYNGHANRATWNVSLWLNNDEGLYNELRSLARRASDVHNLAETIEQFCRSVWENGQTPDNDSLDDADFDEIASGEWETYREDDDPETGEPKEPEDDTETVSPAKTPLESFIAKHGIGFEQHTVYTRPDGLMDAGMFHYKCRITCGRRGFGLYFSTGKGWTRRPKDRGIRARPDPDFSLSSGSLRGTIWFRAIGLYGRPRHDWISGVRVS